MCGDAGDVDGHIKIIARVDIATVAGLPENRACKQYMQFAVRYAYP